MNEFNIKNGFISNNNSIVLGSLIATSISATTYYNLQAFTATTVSATTIIANTLGFRNVANTFTSFFSNTNTGSRTYTFQDRNGTIADLTDVATKMNIPSLTASYIPKAITTTTIGNSRIVDTDTYLGVGTVNTPTKDITLGYQANREIGIELSNSTTVGRDLILTAGKTINYALNTYFNSINQPAGSWFGLAVSTSGVVYTYNSVNGNVYTQTGGSGNFIDTGISIPSEVCNFAAHINGNMYATRNNVGIYMQTGGTGSFSLVQSLSGVRSIACNPINGNVYACVLGGDIYMQTAGAGTFNALGQTARRWEGLTVHINGNVYASVDSGDIYMQTAGIGTFDGLGQTIRQWGLMACNPINGDVYALGINIEWAGVADIYIQTGGVGNFVATVNTPNSWRGIAAYPNGNMYACSYGAGNPNIFVQNNSTVGTANLQGGTLKLNSGTGKGSGDSSIEMYTGQILASGTTMQTATLRAKIDNTGLMTLPSVTNALISGDTTGKALVTKEYLALSSFNYIQNFFIDTVNGNDSTGIQGNISRPFKTIDAAFALFDHDVEYNINKAYTLNLMTDGTYYVNIALTGNNITINSSAFCTISFENNPNTIVFNTAAFSAPNLTINAKQSKIVFSSTVAQRMNVNNLFLDVSEINSGLGSERYLFTVVSFDVKVKKIIATSGIIGGGTGVSTIHTINKIVCPHLIVNYTAYLFSYNTSNSYSIYDFRGYIESTGHIIFNANGHSELLLGNLNVVSGDFVLGVGDIQLKVVFYDSIISGIPFLDTGSYVNTRLTLTGSLDATSAPIGGVNYDTTGTLTFDNFRGSLHSGFTIGPYNLIVKDSNITTTGVPFNRDYWVSGKKREFYGSNSIYSTNPTVIFGGNYVDTIDVYGTLLSNITSIGLGVTIVNKTPMEYPYLPTDIRVTGATYSNNIFTHTNNTGGTYNVLFNTVTGLTVNGNLTVTGTTFKGNGSFTKGGYASGDILLDNGSTDSPGVLMYYTNNSNYGLDTWNGTYDVLSGQLFRVTNNLNESGGAVKMVIDTSGNLVVNGFVKPNAWRAGQTIQTILFSASDLSFNSNYTNNTNTYTSIVTGTYTPLSTSSYIFFEVYAMYDVGGAAADSFFSQITWNGSEIGVQRQVWANGSGGGTRSGTLFPLVGRVTNGSTTGYGWAVNTRRDSSDDDITVYNNSGFYVKITEIAR